MNWKPLVSFLVISTLLLTALVGGPGCANIIPPAGGPRDSLPPVLVKATPGDSTIRFAGNRIDFLFNEYVEIDNYQQHLIVSPFPEQTPNVTRKLETVTVKLRGELEPNTTYTIDFGKTIKDLNEGNVYENFRYIFTTGTYFDSLEFRGNVIMAESGEVDTTLGVMLHRSAKDSAVRDETPRYVTRVDNKGNFHFRNLAPGVYYAYAVKDESNRFRYLQASQPFAFADSAVTIGQTNQPLTLYAYAIPEPQKAVTETTEDKKTEKRLKFGVNLQGSEQDLLSPFIFTFDKPLRDFDSAKIRFVTDTTYTPVTGYNWILDSTRRKLTLNYTWKENTLYHFILEKDFATDSLGQQLLKSDTLDFNSKRTSDYGKLRLRFKNLDLGKNPVLQFVQNKEVRNSYPLTSVDFTRDLFLPGDYNLRILQDDNKNGKWDPGDFYGTRKQPELVKPLARKITVKANLEVPIEVDVNAPIVDETLQQRPGQQQQRPGQQRPVPRQQTLPRRMDL